jgi:hypothetical protein
MLTNISIRCGRDGLQYLTQLHNPISPWVRRLALG